MKLLYVFQSPSCAGCIEAKPHLERYEKEFPGKPFVIRVNPNLLDWRVGDFHPRYTPSYAIVDRSVVLGAIEGQLLTYEALKAFVSDPSGYAESRKKQRTEAHA